MMNTHTFFIKIFFIQLLFCVHLVQASDGCPTQICWPGSLGCSTPGAPFSFHELKPYPEPLTGQETAEQTSRHEVTIRSFHRQERYLITYLLQSRYNNYSDHVYIQEYDFSKREPRGPWQKIYSQYPFDEPYDITLQSEVRGIYINTTHAARIINTGSQKACISIRRAPLLREGMLSEDSKKSIFEQGIELDTKDPKYINPQP